MSHLRRRIRIQMSPPGCYLVGKGMQRILRLDVSSQAKGLKATIDAVSSA